MIIVDKALQERKNKPIRVGMVGAGFMGKGIAYQLQKTVGMKLVAISNRTPTRAVDVFTHALKNPNQIRVLSDQGAVDAAIGDGYRVVTDSPFLLCRSSQIDVIVEVTGSVEFACRVVMEAIRGKKHVVLMNPEVDGTVGLALKKYADEAGVIITTADGDQPGVIMNLYRFVKGIGIQPVLCGNIKGFHDVYRNPTTQLDFARKWGQNVNMVTSFCDGTKVSFEQAIVANATGMTVARRGMTGPAVSKGTHIKDVMNLFPLDAAGSGIVDYVVGAEPSPGVFVIGYCDDPFLKHYLNLFKLGEGPYYCYYVPYHLCFFEVPSSIARAVIFKDSTMSPVGQYVDVVGAAKVDLEEGEVIDYLGGYKLYGLAENHGVVKRENIIPIGLTQGCIVMRKIARDTILRYDDVEMPSQRLCDILRAEQDSF